MLKFRLFYHPFVKWTFVSGPFPKAQSSLLLLCVTMMDLESRSELLASGFHHIIAPAALLHSYLHLFTPLTLLRHWRSDSLGLEAGDLILPSHAVG